MAYREPDETLALLPGNGRGLDEDEAALQIARWKAELDYEPTNAREQALAETIVDTGALGVLLQEQARKDGFLQTPSADAMVARAETALERYNALHDTLGDTDGEYAYVEESPF